MFAEPGLDAPMKDIARHAGAGAATFCRRFPPAPAAATAARWPTCCPVPAAGYLLVTAPAGTPATTLATLSDNVVDGSAGPPLAAQPGAAS